MLRRNSFSWTVQARSTPAEAARLLADPGRQADLHPGGVRVRRLRPRSGARSSHAVTEPVPVGPVRLPLTHRVDVLVAADDEVVTVARHTAGVTVRSRARLRGEPDGLARIEVEVTVAAPATIFGYVFRQARAAHLALASRLGAVLDTGPPAG